MNESDLYKELGTLTKDRERWETSIPYVSSLLSHDSVKIQAKVLWLLGEMGLTYPRSVQDAVSDIAAFCDSPVSILRERAVNALGRIGRGNYILIEPFWEDLFRFASDEDPKIVAAYDDAKLEELMQDAGIIRNRQKLKAAITNAQAFLNVQKEFGTFDKYIWSFTNGQVIDHHLLDGKDMPAKDELSERISNLILIAGHVKEHARRLILSLGKSNIWMGAVISMMLGSKGPSAPKLPVDCSR